jgi:hypothetical protein
VRCAALVLAVLAGAPAAAAADVDESDFRYVRELRARAGAGAILFRADGPLFAHARLGFPDLRIVDADGAQVPWRRPPETEQADVAVDVLNRGRGAEGVFAMLDIGEQRRVIDRIELEIAGTDFLGRVTVAGSDARGGPFFTLGTTAVYDVAGAEAHARSTTVVFPPTDFRYFRLVGRRVPPITGAIVSARPRRSQPAPLRASVARTESDDRTVVVVDLRYPKIPVDEVRVEATTDRYDREVLIEASDPGTAWRTVAFTRIVHFPGTLTATLPVDVNARFVRLTIFNGDDTPLAGIRATPFARPRLLLAEGRHPLPYRVVYGGATASAPRYDFARLPAAALPRAVAGTLGPEQPNRDFQPPADDRSFLDRNPWALQVVLALVAIALALAGFVVLRRRT